MNRKTFGFDNFYYKYRYDKNKEIVLEEQKYKFPHSLLVDKLFKVDSMKTLQ